MFLVKTAVVLEFAEFQDYKEYDYVYEIDVMNVLSPELKKHIYYYIISDFTKIEIYKLNNQFIIQFDLYKLINITKEFMLNRIDLNKYVIYGSYTRKSKNIYMVISVKNRGK